MYTVTAARTRLRHIMYSVGAHGVTAARYGAMAGLVDTRQARGTERAASYGIVHVPRRHPAYDDYDD